MESVSLQRRSIKRLVIDQPDAAEEDVSPAKRQAWWSPPMTRSRARKQELELQQTMVLQSSNIANAGPRVRKSASGSSVLERTLSGANAADVPTPPVSPSLLASHPLADHENDPEAGPSEREIAEARAAAARLGIGGTNQPALARKSPQQRKLPSGPEPQQYDIQYTPRSALQPLESPREAAAGVAAQLAALQWHTAFEALHTARRLVAHHRAEVQDRVPELLRLVLKSLRSPRSQLCKAAVMCAGDFFDAFEDEVAGEVDKGGVARPAESIVHQLLIKATSNDKKFVSEEAKAALAELARTLQAPNATKASPDVPTDTVSRISVPRSARSAHAVLTRRPRPRVPSCRCSGRTARRTATRACGGRPPRRWRRRRGTRSRPACSRRGRWGARCRSWRRC
ncbi:unnamed protein product [Pedinophyceae sp. YPF-701]|nr:unnamed protein product [Pedinophyceae sp. YPF-701]